MQTIQSRMPSTYNTYFEPFFGGGAVFFSLQPKQAVINDKNVFLINTYNKIKENPYKVIEILSEYETAYNSLKTKEEKDMYYLGARKRFNDNTTNDLSLAALFIFLNKTCFNGLYRVNQKGYFNVPSAHKENIKLYDTKNILEVSDSLKNTEIYNDDFELICSKAAEGDFVFFDSPYYDTFDSYQSGGFSEADHKRLYDLFCKLTDKGVYCMLTNSNTDFIKELYKKYSIEIVDVKRMINCDSSKRKGTEVIVVNY